MFSKDIGAIYQLSYRIQTSFFWGITIKVLSFIYMYLILFDDSHWQTASKILATGALVLFWIDLILQIIHTSKDFARKQSKYTGILFLRFITLILLIIEIGIHWKNVTTSGGRPINPFLIVRACKFKIIQYCQLYMSLKFEGPLRLQDQLIAHF